MIRIITFVVTIVSLFAAQASACDRCGNPLHLVGGGGSPAAFQLGQSLDLYGGIKWGSQTLGTPVTLNYAFFDEGLAYRDGKSFVATTPEVKNLVVDCMDEISGFAGITFVDRGTSMLPWNAYNPTVDIAFGMANIRAMGEAYLPMINGPSGAGDVILDTDTPAERIRKTIMHELWHALGFVHSALNTDMMFRFDIPSINGPSEREKDQFAMVYGPSLTVAVPEPSSIVLAVVGMVFVCFLRKSR